MMMMMIIFFSFPVAIFCQSTLYLPANNNSYFYICRDIDTLLDFGLTGVSS